MNNKKEASKNNRNRFVYSFLFIFILILVSIMYASLAINIGTKVKIPKIIEPTDKPVNIMPQTGEESAPITKRSRKRTKVDPVTPVVPVIEPDDINWKIEFDNVKIDNGSVRAVKDATIDSSKTEITYEVIMTEPGQFYSFKVDILNKGNVDAKLYNIIESGMTDEQKRFLKYSVTYDDGTEIKVGDALNKNNKKQLKVYLQFKEDVNPDDLPDGGELITLSYKLEYVQK